ncbi:glycosyltransferase family 4 protein [Sutcliffiella horikoshii]|uniref:Glycosyltransferase family 4 protein n=1 Tax=Sutcliffiella horikoshii TaxID=79883 RepID=A0AA94WPX5_9BACI|nr:glycosyltransferase [Sutcliffiella horikoshii]TYS59920.1 glycosyltransferase family 4 protein [Sutcliffiella horikoshii]
MRVLHLSSYYITNKLYMNLFKQLSTKGLEQDVFIPVKSSNSIGVNQLPSDYKTVHYHYKNIVKPQHKIMYFNKISKQMKEIEQEILSKNDIDVIHAHTIFSDGGSAYKLHKKYNIEYVVSVRSTDINSFYKYGYHLRPFMYKVLLNAKNIVFISNAYQKKVFELLPKKVLDQIKDKCLIIPNGIDDYWHENARREDKPAPSKKMKLVFVGILDENKNIKTVIKTCEMLNSQGINTSLEVFGSGPLEQECKDLTKSLDLQQKVTFHGYITDKKVIAATMEQSDIFVMPSFRETFGLVYIEAMSKGLPVIYSKGEGLDGMFEDGAVGYAVDPTSATKITDTIHTIMDNYESISSRCLKEAKPFNWNNIGGKYYELYK